eukprot:2960464-Rhodomonas_salina.2
MGLVLTSEWCRRGGSLSRKRFGSICLALTSHAGSCCRLRGADVDIGLGSRTSGCEPDGPAG